MAKKPIRSLRWIIKAVFYGAVAWVLGLGYFFFKLPPTIDAAAIEENDGIVVLTGGAGRLEAGLVLLEKKKARRLLISGVNPVVEPSELSRLTGTEEALFACCIDLDRAANTEANAVETARWARGHDYKRILIVTADYHVPRSLLLFRRALPEARLTAYPVKGDWPVVFIVREYNKYAFTLLGAAITGARPSQSGGENLKAEADK